MFTANTPTSPPPPMHFWCHQKNLIISLYSELPAAAPRALWKGGWGSGPAPPTGCLSGFPPQMGRHTWSVSAQSKNQRDPQKILIRLTLFHFLTVNCLSEPYSYQQSHLTLT